MSLELLSAHETDEGIAVTFVTERGLEPLEGTRGEVAQLARAMRQVSVLAALNEDDKVWLESVPVGDAIVKLGLNPGGQARVHIVRRRIRRA
jgi:hypothetical protein